MELERLITDFEACMGWPYASPGSNSSRGIDCSGMFARAYHLQGAEIPHGSNSIWRYHLGDKGELLPGSRLCRGMAVFKHRPQDTAKYRDGEGDFHHIGLVTRVEPLRIVHASSAQGRVVADTSADAWSHWGYLKAVRYPLPAWAEEPQERNLRRGMRGDDVAALQLRLRQWGYELEADGIFGPVTQSCVRAFQRRHGLEADGIVGPRTRQALEGGAV